MKNLDFKLDSNRTKDNIKHGEWLFTCSMKPVQFDKWDLRSPVGYYVERNSLLFSLQNWDNINLDEKERTILKSYELESLYKKLKISNIPFKNYTCREIINIIDDFKDRIISFILPNYLEKNEDGITKWNNLPSNDKLDFIYDDFTTIDGSSHSRKNCSLKLISEEYALWFIKNKCWEIFDKVNDWEIYENTIQEMCLKDNINYEGF